MSEMIIGLAIATGVAFMSMYGDVKKEYVLFMGIACLLAVVLLR